MRHGAATNVVAVVTLARPIAVAVRLKVVYIFTSNDLHTARASGSVAAVFTLRNHREQRSDEKL